MKISLSCILIIVFTTTTWAHDPKVHSVNNEPFWSEKYEVPNEYGGDMVSCCDGSDLHFIPHWKANALHIGSIYKMPWSRGTYDVEIKGIFPTEDPKGRSAITASGCLFRPFGM